MTDTEPQPPSQPQHTAVAQLARLDARVPGLAGKFHAHLTVLVASTEEIEALRALARSLRIKLTVIDLADNTGRSQRDVMTTEHFRDTEPGALLRIGRQLDTTVARLRASGFTVVRTKLEHESLPTLERFDRTHYHEAHVKLRIPAAIYPQRVARLRELGRQLGFVASRNPRARTIDGAVAHFANMRFYDGDATAAGQTLALVVDQLDADGFAVSQMKRETVLLDTNLEHDKWWA